MIVPTDEFDWDDSEVLVLPEQPATAVFLNGNGAVVVRQRCPDDEDSDVYVLIQPHNARLVASAILAAAKQSAASIEDDISQARAPTKSAAERQRRYRQRQHERNARNADTVTRDGESVTRDGPLFTQAAE